MADEVADVKVKLVVVSNHEEETKKLKEELGKTNTSAAGFANDLAKRMGAGMSAGTVAMGNFYFEFAKLAYEKGKEAFTAPIEAFMESAKQIKGIAGTFAAIDRAGNSMETLKIWAAQTKDEFQEMGMRIGVADDALVEMFTNVIERGGKSVEQAKKLTEEIAMAGRAIPGGAKGMSEGLEAIQMGVIRARNPIVGMIAATGVLKGNSKQVAAAMMQMSPERQMKLAEKAIGMMANKMRNVPMSMGEAWTSLKGMSNKLLETMGEPMTKALSKGVLAFRGLFFDDKGGATELVKTLTQGFKTAGDFLANSFTVVKPFIDGFMETFDTFAEETRVMWKEIMGDGVSQWQSIRDIAKGVGVALGLVVSSLGSGIAAIVLASQKALKYLTIGVGLLLQGFGEMDEMASHVAETLGHVEEAAALHAAARKEKEAGAQTMLFGFGGEQNETLAKVRATGGGNLTDLRDKFFENVSLAHPADNRKYIAEYEAAAKERQVMEQNVAIAQTYAADNTKASSLSYLQAFEFASKAHDEAAMKNIANFLGSNKKIAEAIGKMAPGVIEGGVTSFIEALKTAGNVDMAKVIEDLQKAKLAKLGNPTTNFNNNTFNIKQDYRDQDPDRVALLFRKDIEKAAVSRIQARVAGIHGF